MASVGRFGPRTRTPSTTLWECWGGAADQRNPCDGHPARARMMWSGSRGVACHPAWPGRRGRRSGRPPSAAEARESALTRTSRAPLSLLMSERAAEARHRRRPAAAGAQLAGLDHLQPDGVCSPAPPCGYGGAGERRPSTGRRHFPEPRLEGHRGLACCNQRSSCGPGPAPASARRPAAYTTTRDTTSEAFSRSDEMITIRYTR